ncbi:MAG: RNA pyrophosphohydrolase [Pseudomonadales bacterium]|nr:RNA pyrophosphohydrolase [Pseudomonadales bacterium]
MIDSDGFRQNVGIVLANPQGQILWARRVGQQAWQFPQGGIDRGESPEQALYRELEEEVGLKQQDIQILGCTRGWLKYRLPDQYRRWDSEARFIGQKQKWFLLLLTSHDNAICLNQGEKPEFDGWRWVSYWYPLGQVIAFKKDVYRKALCELAPNMAETDILAKNDSGFMSVSSTSYPVTGHSENA